MTVHHSRVPTILPAEILLIHPDLLRERNTSMAHLQCHLFTLQNWAQHGLTRPHSSNTPQDSFEKIVSLMTHREGAILLWFTNAPFLPCSVPSALCFPFQRQFRICFCAFGSIQQLPQLAKRKSAVIFPPTHCLPEIQINCAPPAIKVFFTSQHTNSFYILWKNLWTS